MHKIIDCRGMACPLPVVNAKKAAEELSAGDVLTVRVDNEIAVQNLTRMANQKGHGVKSEKLGEKQFKVTITVGTLNAANAEPEEVVCVLPSNRKKNTVVVISSKAMGHGGDELGTALMKGFLYALSQQEELPSAMLFYNSGAKLTAEGAVTVEDLKNLEAQGVEILTCGTCLDYYGLKDTLLVGSVTNMYTIVEKLTGADLVVKP